MSLFCADFGFRSLSSMCFVFVSVIGFLFESVLSTLSVHRSSYLKVCLTNYPFESNLVI